MLSYWVHIIFMHNISVYVKQLHLVFKQKFFLLYIRCTYYFILWLAWQKIDSNKLENWREEISTEL
jgi:hypothetical protein